MTSVPAPPRIARGGKAIYGAPLGILMLEARFPRRYAWVTDSYFQAGFVEETRRWEQPSDHVPLITEFAL